MRREWTLRAHGTQVVFVKRANERTDHVVMRAFLWGLYLPAYPDLVVEVPVRDRYRPDVVSLEPCGKPRLWGEAGHVSPDKIRSLTSRYRDTQFALSKWRAPLEPFADVVREALREFPRSVAFDLLRFPADSAERFIGDRGEATVSHADLDWVRLS